MRYIGRRRGLTRRPSAYKRLLALSLTLMVVWGILCETGSRFISQELAEEAIQHYLRSAVNRAVSAELEDRESAFAQVSPTGIRTDAAALNSLKSGVMERLEKSLNGRAKASVPIGSLTRLRIFAGRGPGVPIRLDIHGSANVVFDTEFTSAGINQSCHRMTMTVRVQAYTGARQFETAAQFETTTVLAETVMVGEVPGAAVLAR